MNVALSNAPGLHHRLGSQSEYSSTCRCNLTYFRSFHGFAASITAEPVWQKEALIEPRIILMHVMQQPDIFLSLSIWLHWAIMGISAPDPPRSLRALHHLDTCDAAT